MSNTYELACLGCRVSLWIGQGYLKSGDDLERIRTAGKIYSTVKHIARLRDFLFIHMRHTLVFDNSDALCQVEYEDFEDILNAASGAPCDDEDGA